MATPTITAFQVAHSVSLYPSTHGEIASHAPRMRLAQSCQRIDPIDPSFRRLGWRLRVRTAEAPGVPPAGCSGAFEDQRAGHPLDRLPQPPRLGRVADR